MSKNILVIFVDELRYDALRMYGNTQIKMPNLESLSMDSTIYSNHFCSYPVCTPSRYSHFSGLYAHQHSVCTNKGTLLSCFDTYPRILKNNGYHNVAVGKMHFSPTYLDIGFDEMILSEQDGEGRFEDDYHKWLYENSQIDLIDIVDQRSEYRGHASREYFSSFGTLISNLECKYHSTTWITMKALEEIRKWNKENEYLFVSYIKPHHPFDPVNEYLNLYDDVDIDILPGYTDSVPDFDYAYDHGYFDNAMLDSTIVKKMTKYYYANLSHIDDGIGRILNLLKEKGIYDDTEIIFTSDHGDYMGFHHMALKQNHMYDSLMRIPLVIKHVHQSDGFLVDCYSDNTQLAADILASVGLKAGKLMNDISLDTDREMIFGMYKRQRDGRDVFSYMVRNKRYKILLEEQFELHLFDLKEDPYELNDIVYDESYHGLINKLLEYLIGQMLFDNPFQNILSSISEKTVSKTVSIAEEQREVLRKYFKTKIDDIKFREY